ncbi:hypothetical protein SAMN05660649_04067 [Desulfotomaculum arcticum]|uniref:SCP-2 sterol transfer family protein n=1 Tax=Desulfotruncus arcticus DSM 17038 TaxID=1121424 RepID=A0A1I2XNR5_9FIRM|nr:SCP2 sterol-binding domain-containing protein [Desulfotruncus arcticus]SFH15134.1 hypothetical protein SAMN05660649_04067 [Desulfotomaculum arcticum] [Desulfotruncus arcticus DSM 17038]
MAVYKDTKQMYEILGGLWSQLLEHPENGKKFRDAGLNIKYNLSDPAGTLWVTPGGVLTGDQNLKADVEMSLAGDTAHKFWLKELSLPAALAKKLIVSKGSMAKVMKMLPLLKPLHEMYPAVSDKYNLPG